MTMPAVTEVWRPQSAHSLYRLYREESLAVRRRRGRKRALGTRRPMLLPEAAN